MLEMLQTMFGYQFMVRALVVGVLVSLCAALLGVSLVLKRYSMIGDGLSHVGFGSLAIATALGLAPMAVTIPVVVAAAFLLLRLSSTGKLKGDAAIAMISTGALAVGVIVLSLSTGMTSDVNNYLFGSVLAMSESDVWLSVTLAAMVLILFVLFYRRIFAVTFDETFARATGGRAELYNMLLAFLTAITIVLGMRVMGAMLISSLVIFPALTAMRICKSFRGVTLCAAAVAVVCFFCGAMLFLCAGDPGGRERSGGKYPCFPVVCADQAGSVALRRGGISGAWRLDEWCAAFKAQLASRSLQLAANGALDLAVFWVGFDGVAWIDGWNGVIGRYGGFGGKDGRNGLGGLGRRCC